MAKDNNNIPVPQVSRQTGGATFRMEMKRLVAKLREQQAETARLDEAITKNLKELGYGGGWGGER